MCRRWVLAVGMLLLGAGALAHAYERQLTSRQIREAYFLGKDTTFHSEQFLKDYVRTFPVPERGLHVGRIALATPFKAIVDRARSAPDGYNPIKAEEEYKQSPPALSVEVTVWLTPSFPAHTPYTVPALGPVGFRDPDFWKAVEVRLEQQGEVEPMARAGRPLYNCDVNGPCWLVGAVITLSFDPEEVASRPASIHVLPPDSPAVETEFDLSRLR